MGDSTLNWLVASGKKIAIWIVALLLLLVLALAAAFFASGLHRQLDLDALKAGMGSFFGRMFQSLGDAPARPAAATPLPVTVEGISAEEDSWLQAMVEADGALDPLERALLKALAED